MNYSKVYTHPGFHLPFFLQSFLNASSHVISFINISNANCGALCPTIHICLPSYFCLMSFKKNCILPFTSSYDFPLGNGVYIYCGFVF